MSGTDLEDRETGQVGKTQAEKDLEELESRSDEFSGLERANEQLAANDKGRDDDGLYTGDGSDSGRGGIRGRLDALAAGNFQLKGAKKKATATILIISLLVTLIGGGFSFLNGFKLHSIVRNLQDKGFSRWQIATDGRTNKWLAAYMTARWLEIDEKGKTPDSLLFRSEKNPMFLKWYNTIRGTDFEKDIFEKRGIKFTSIAVRDGNIIKVRPAKITVKGTELTFDPTKGPDKIDASIIERATNGDISALQQIERLTGKMNEFVDVQVFEGDWAGRDAIRQMLNEELPGVHNAITRWLVRKDVERMTGTRSWRFFEKTRLKNEDRVTSIRNRVIAKSLPDSTKTGRIVQCLFGVTDCKGSSDVANPDNKAPSPKVTGQAGSQNNTVDANGNPVPANNGEAATAVNEALQGAETKAGAEGIQKFITRELIKKFNGATAVVSFFDSLARIDKQIASGGLIALVASEKGKQAADLATTFMVADGNLVTGNDVAGEDQDALMAMVNGVTNSEGWTTVIDPSTSAGKVSAAPLTPIAKESYCSAEHQAKLIEDEFHYNCNPIGATATADKITAGWNAIIGPIHPALSAYINSPAGPIAGFVLSIFDSITGPIVNAIIASVPGLQGKIQDISAYFAVKVMAFLGAGPILNGSEPSGVITNVLVMGIAYLGESTLRYHGGAATTAESKAFATQQYYTAMQDRQKSMSSYDKFLSLDNTDSVASKQLFAMSNLTPSKTIINLTNSLAKLPMNLASAFTGQHAYAATTPDPYAGDKFADIESFDFPPECMRQSPLSMTPQSATNADDLGIIPANELTWDMISSSDTFYTTLYAKLGNGDNVEAKAKKVYNCALLDDAAATGLGAKYGYKGPNALGVAEATESSPTTTNIIKGDTSNIPCGAGTDQGVAEGWSNGNKFSIRICDVQGIVVNSQIAATIDKLVNDANAQGIKFTGYGYRTNQRQIELRQQNCPNVYVAPASSCNPDTARPGFSNHQMGLAVDFGENGKSICYPNDSASCVGNKAFDWLVKNASNYGLKNLSTEAWHWSVDGS